MTKSKKGFFKNSVALAMLASVAMGGQALAQQPADPADATAEEEEEEESSIVVTGTRIRSEFNSASPVQVITIESATLAGVTDTGEMVQSSSLAAGSPQIDATISSAFVTDGGPGAQTISLRGLGANRTLVLLNGRRAGPAGTRGAVSAFDLNVLPLSMIDRVEILKDGASSIYGSDAVAGVVNIITRRDLDGASATLRYSQPQEEGGEEIAGDISWGRTFDRGYLNVALDYYRQEETTQGSRDYTNCGVDNTTSVATGARNDVVDLRTGDFACRSNVATGLVWLYDYSGEGQLQNGVGANFIQFDGSGQIGTLLPGTVFPAPLSPAGPTAPANWFQVNYDAPSSGLIDTNSPFEQTASVFPEIQRTTVYADGAFEITPRVEAYAEVLLNRRETATNGFRQVWTYLYSYDLGDPFNVGWGGVTVISPTPTTDHFDASQQVDYSRVVAGLRGDFDGWLGAINWDIYIQSSRSDASYTSDVILNDAVDSADGRSDFGTSGLFNANSIPRATASCVGFNTPISNRPCVDVDWMSAVLMGGGGFTAAEEAFLYDNETGNTEYTQNFIEATIGSDLFALPAGHVAGVIGFVHREDEITDTPGEVTLAGNSWGLSSAGITAGTDTTQEIFGEVAIPLLRNSPAADSLELTLSGRHTDVESYGENSTHKIGLTWQVNNEFLVRYTQGTSFRAPALFELYLAGQTSFARNSTLDPCTQWANQLALGNITQTQANNCAFSGGPNPVGGIPGNYTGAGASATIIASGGAGLLEAETSEARVFGIVWTPSFANLSVAVDYFHIDVQDEVDQIGPAQILFQCYNSPTFPVDPICSLFDRGIGLNPFLIETVNNSYLNVASQINRGLDVTARYVMEFPIGDLTLQGQFTWQFEDVVELFEGTAQDFNGFNGDPDFVGNFDVQFDRDDWTFFWRMNLIGHSSDIDTVADTNSTGTTRFDIDAEFTTYHAFSARREFDTWTFVAGVANAFDQEPPTVSTVGGAAQTTLGPSLLSSQYDYLGRRLFLRVTKEF